MDNEQSFSDIVSFAKDDASSIDTEEGDLSVGGNAKLRSVQDLKLTIYDNIDLKANNNNTNNGMISPSEAPLKGGSVPPDRFSLFSIARNSTIKSSSLRSQSAANVPCSFWKHPRVKKNPRTIIASTLLFLAGISCFALAIAELVNSATTQGVIFLIIAIFTGLPGGYQLFYIYRAIHGAPGYGFSGITSFDP